MNAHCRAFPDDKPLARFLAKRRSTASALVLQGVGAGHQRAQLSSRLRRVLLAHPQARHFTVHRIVKALGEDAAPSLALFSAAGVFEAPDVRALSAHITSALGAGLALGHRNVSLPRSLLRRRIPRNSLALLIHGVATMLDAGSGLMRERWSWMFHPAMSVALGVTLFLLGLASMVPLIGGGAQHAAAAFLIAVGQAERDGLAVMIGAVAGIASLAVAVLSLSSGRKIWRKIKAWLMRCARKLKLKALYALLDRCSEGLGALARMNWSELLLLLMSPESDTPIRRRIAGEAEPALRARSRRSRIAATRSLIANREVTMDLEQFFIFSIESPLDNEKRKILESEITGSALALEKDVSLKWLKRGEEKFLRILSDPATVELVFFDDRIECYGAAPAWARLLLTRSRRQELKSRIESVLVLAGFVPGETV
jgi:hypothetical protein